MRNDILKVFYVWLLRATSVLASCTDHLKHVRQQWTEKPLGNSEMETQDPQRTEERGGWPAFLKRKIPLHQAAMHSQTPVVV